MSHLVHPETLFHLEPVGEAAAVLENDHNKPFVSLSSAGKPSLEIGYHVPSIFRGGRVIARLGRDADLVIPAPNISALHISFEVHPFSHAILLCDRSRRPGSVQIEPGGFYGRSRQRVLVPGARYQITLGVRRRFCFKVRWREIQIARAVDKGFEVAQFRTQDSRSAGTEDEDSDTGTWYRAKSQPAAGRGKVRGAQFHEWLGGRDYWDMCKAIDLDSGQFIAVKSMRPRDEKERASVYREMKALEVFEHPYIIEHLGSAGSFAGSQDPAAVDIFLPLRMGTVASLRPLPIETYGRTLTQLLEQMLSALDYLSSQDLCHRDIKPENILFDKIGDDYMFQLADFSLVGQQQQQQQQEEADTIYGTWIYSAPELHPEHGQGRHRQSPKMDVWSLYVTIIAMLPQVDFNAGRLVDRPFSEMLAFVRGVAADPDIMPALAPMAREDPELRASAAQMLVGLFDGWGLSTPRSDVPLLAAG